MINLAPRINKINTKGYFQEQKLNILLYNSGLKTEFHMGWWNLPKTNMSLQNCVFSQTFYPYIPIFYTDISSISVTFRNSGVLVVLIGVLGVLVGVLGGFCIWDGVYVIWLYEMFPVEKKVHRLEKNNTPTPWVA